MSLVEISSEEHAARQTAARLGYLASTVLAILAIFGFSLGIVTPPRSGPYCTGACIAYPYAEAAQFFPRDYWWMAPASLLAPFFMAVAVCLFFCISEMSKPWCMLGVCFSALSTAIIAMVYSIQVLAIQPSLVHGEMDGVAIFTQYNAHGIFIVLEDVGYLFLAIAFLLLGMAVPRSVRPGTVLRWTLLIAGSLSFVALAAFSVIFGLEMALPFELAIISIIWIGLSLSGVLFAFLFKRMRFQQVDG